MGKTLKTLALCLLSMFLFINNINADELIYGEDIPEGCEGEYQYVEDETIEDAYTDLSEEEANSLKVTLEASGYTTVTIRKYSVKTGEDINTITETFESEEAALNYIAELEANGLVVTDIVFVNDQENKTIDETYETEEAATTALNDFENNYTVDGEPSITPVRDETEDSDVSFNQDFDNEDAANDYLAGQQALGENDDNVEVTGEVNHTQTPGESISINEVYESQDAANAGLSNYNNQYDVVEVENDEIQEVLAGTIYDAVVITPYQNEYEIGNSIYIIVRHGQNKFVWTLNQLSASEISEFKRSYPDFIVDQTIPNLNDATFIYGINNEYTLDGGLFTVEERNGKLVAIMSPNMVSHAVYGEFTPVNEYHLVATAFNYIHNWNVSGNVHTTGYDYNLVVSGTRELESGVLTATTSEDIIEDKYALDLVRQKFEFIGGMGEGEDPDEEPIEEPTNIPQTGDNIIYTVVISLISLIGLVSTLVLNKTIE